MLVESVGQRDKIKGTNLKQIAKAIPCLQLIPTSSRTASRKVDLTRVHEGGHGPDLATWSLRKARRLFRQGPGPVNLVLMSFTGSQVGSGPWAGCLNLISSHNI